MMKCISGYVVCRGSRSVTPPPAGEEAGRVRPLPACWWLPAAFSSSLSFPLLDHRHHGSHACSRVSSGFRLGFRAVPRTWGERRECGQWVEGMLFGLLWQRPPPHSESFPRKGLSQSALPYRRSVPTVSSVRGPGRGWGNHSTRRKLHQHGGHLCKRSAAMRMEGPLCLGTIPGFSP